MRWMMCAVCLLVAATAQAASAWKPERPIEVVVGTGPGGGQDKTARVLARILQERKLVATPTTVLNRPGGGGTLAWLYLNQRPGDAHAIGVGNPTLLSNHVLGRSPLSHRDLTPLAMLFTESVAITVRADSPIRNGRDLLERLRADSGALSFSVGSSLGSANHIAMGELARLAGGDVKKLKAVVFQGGGEAMTALLGGHVDLIASAVNNVVPHLPQGKIRVLGITSVHRLGGVLAGVPTWREQGADVTTSNWRMVAGARGLDASRIAYWDDALKRAVDTDEWKADLERNGFEPLYMPAAASQAYLQAQYDALRRALGELGMTK